VIIFHLGFLKNGYLGVDIFFVISGYLITTIVYKEVNDDKFSVTQFYVRRLRRIFPLVLFTTFCALILGIVFMLPYDLKNLSYSVIASNFSINNIVTWITSADYWNVVNDYKPLMHTWSLGIEEQFYIVYPIIFYFLSGKRRIFIVPTLVVFSIISLLLFILSDNEPSRFYLLQYRFYELSFGGICAVYFVKNPNKLKYFQNEWLLLLAVFFLLIIMVVPFFISSVFKIPIVVLLTAAVLVFGGQNFEKPDNKYRYLFCNPIIVYIGKISFSLYMWHQIVFAYARYFVYQEIKFYNSVLLIIITLILSVFTYHFLETPFRKKSIINTKKLFYIISISFVIVNGRSEEH